MTSLALAMRPAALMRGATRKATWPALGDSPAANPETSSSARRPGFFTSRNPARPRFTMTRFSPVSGTTSATVAIATSFKKDSSEPLAARGIPIPTLQSSASISFSATPAPHRFFSGYGNRGDWD